MMLAIADCLNDRGSYQPTIDQLAQMVNVSVRNAHIIIGKLVEAGELRAIKGGGRGNRTSYEINLPVRGKSESGFTEKTTGNSEKDFTENPRQNSERDFSEKENSEKENSEIPCRETVKASVENSESQCRTLRNTPIYPNTPEHDGDVARAGADVPAHTRESAAAAVIPFGKNSSSNFPNRHSEHPAVSAYLSVTKLTSLNQWKRDEIIRVIGDEPDRVEEWCEHVRWWCRQDWKPENVNGMLDRFQNPKPNDNLDRKEQPKRGSHRQSHPGRVRADFSNVKSAV